MIDLADNLDNISDYDMEAESEQSDESYTPSNVSDKESQSTEETVPKEETTATDKTKKETVAVIWSSITNDHKPQLKISSEKTVCY
ncbi:hypothetical protein FQA39_LY04832 [Lamprigera yunnana]|nr:hypothetical protein FQA39_LY04832 [Lamprigera yunnana]